MTIEGALPHAWQTILDGSAARPAAPPPTAHSDAWSGAPGTAQAQDLPQGPASRRPLLLRGALSGLHRRALQNPPAARTTFSQPGATSTDSQLAAALEKGYDMLHPFLKDGRLTCSSLQLLAAQRMGESEALDRVIPVAREILQRPRLSDAILSGEGDITRDSLRAAASALLGNSSPSVYSQDPFHAQGNAQVVQAFQGLFEQLRDKSKDRSYFFEPHQFVEIVTLKRVMQDPYDVDQRGEAVLDPSTGMPRPKYSELCVYTAKNIIERPGLLRSLERANGARLFGPPHQEGWLSNKSLDRWLEQDEAHKAR